MKTCKGGMLSRWTLASEGSHQPIRLWDVASGKQRSTPEGHKGDVLSVSFGADERTLASDGRDGTIRIWDSRGQNPFDASGFQYEAQQLDHRLFHVEKRIDSKGQSVVEHKDEANYVLGSGTRGRSYLIDHDGFLFQSPISWYAGTNVWDLAPGYRSRNQHFNRPVPDECIYCHANQADPVPDSLNHFRTPLFRGYAIGCERCHGPGELHVRLRESNERVVGLDTTIVNPERLEPRLRESVCQQCHLQAVVRTVKRNRRREDYRPGLPLSEFVSFFVFPPNQADVKRAVGHVEQMYAGRCFQASGQKLGCLSCHDPHNYPPANEKPKFYRDRCLTCHEETSCALELSVRRRSSPNDSCITCHMPTVASSNIAHTAITDHRIVRIPGKDRRNTRRKEAAPEKYPIVPFDEEGTNASAPDEQRDLGIALIEFASKQPSFKGGSLAVSLLAQSLSHWPEDMPAWEAKGYALMLQDRNEESLRAFQAALRVAPNREKSLFGAALIAARLGQAENSVKYWKEIIALNPWNWEYHDELAKIYAARREWKLAAEECKNAVRLNLAAWDTRKLLVNCLLRLGKKAEAQREFEILLGFEPPDPEALRRWFAEEGLER